MCIKERKTSDGNEERALPDNTSKETKNDGIFSSMLLKTAFWMTVWYGTSLCTLFLNKIILEMPSPDALRNGVDADNEVLDDGENAAGNGGLAGNIGDGNVHLLGAVQMTTTAVLGGIKVVIIPLMQRLYRHVKAVVKDHRRMKGRGTFEIWNFFRRRHNYAVVSQREVADGGDVESQSRQQIAERDRDQQKGWGILGNRKLLYALAVVGFLRALTVLLGLLSLSHVAVSFVETVKSSAPLFTVIFAYMILGERTSTGVVVSLLPVMGGLILCSAYELSFDMIGFAAAVTNNCVDCVQNVMSKKLLSTASSSSNESKSNGGSSKRSPGYTLTPAELQFYTSFSALLLQPLFAFRSSLPSNLWSIAWSGASDVLSPSSANTNPLIRKLYTCLLIDATAYHLQSVSAYYTMSCVGPVTMSVANTVKRALLIWMSVLYFGNPMSDYAVIGTLCVLGGVFWYNKARRRDTGSAAAVAAAAAAAATEKSTKFC
mmetsp:Transcript_17446/g.26494  ORF Transcript_17446/g.26494 Transcript_17446/m.26494 type:complete len:488 (-) Transcript_17446:335-1798(-)